MKAAKFPLSNATLSAPAGLPDVQPLPVYTDGQTVVSCWRMSWRERLSALVVGKCWLAVLSGKTQPPVVLSVERRFLRLK
jgi:hypothetical protein